MAMEGYRWSLGTFLAGVAAFVAISGWAPRMQADQYEAIALSAEEQAMVSAYVGPMQRFASIYHRENAPLPSETLRVAKAWVDDYRVGRIGEIIMRNGDDSCRDGVKGQISDARDQMACDLRNYADLQVAKGHYAEANRYFRTAIELLEILKYSDLPSLSSSLGYQNQMLRHSHAIPPEHRQPLNWARPGSFPVELKRLARLELVFDDNIGRFGRVVDSRSTTRRLNTLNGLKCNLESVAATISAVSDASYFPARPGLHVRMAIRRWWEQEELLKSPPAQTTTPTEEFENSSVGVGHLLTDNRVRR